MRGHLGHLDMRLTGNRGGRYRRKKNAIPAKQISWVSPGIQQMVDHSTPYSNHEAWPSFWGLVVIAQLQPEAWPPRLEATVGGALPWRGHRRPHYHRFHRRRPRHRRPRHGRPHHCRPHQRRARHHRLRGRETSAWGSGWRRRRHNHHHSNHRFRSLREGVSAGGSDECCRRRQCRSSAASVVRQTAERPSR